MKRLIGLIPTRLTSKRLPGKALADIEGIPLVVHTAKRAEMSSKLDEVFVCTDSPKIEDVCLSYNLKTLFLEGNFKNGTERIAASASKLDSDFFIDIQGDEPLVDPKHIDSVAESLCSKESKHEIILPLLRVPYSSPETIVKVQTSLSGRVMTLSRSSLPCRYGGSLQFVYKHLSVIGFTRNALLKYASLPPTPYEEVESIELLRALENDISIGTICLQGDSFSVDIQDDLDRARLAMRNDPLFCRYQ